MSNILLEQWKEMLDNQTEESVDSFWKDYSGTETRIYEDILRKQNPVFEGKISELADQYKTSSALIVGFLDGINTSLFEEIKLEALDEDSEISIKIDFEKLYFNMHLAGADYLYELTEWEAIFTPEKLFEIEKAFKKSKTVIKGEKIGRNDPCPCGSGKKYKKCCGIDEV